MYLFMFLIYIYIYIYVYMFFLLKKHICKHIYYLLLLYNIYALRFSSIRRRNSIRRLDSIQCFNQIVESAARRKRLSLRHASIAGAAESAIQLNRRIELSQRIELSLRR